MAIDLGSNVKSAAAVNAAKQTKQRAAKKAQPGSVPAASVAHAQLFYGSSGEMHRKMIADAAYYLAAQRGFAPGHELDDWLAAERELDERLCGEIHPF